MSAPVQPVVLPPDRERAFRQAIKAVCAEHGAEMQVVSRGDGGNCALVVSMSSVWNGDQQVKPFVEFDW